MISGYCLVLVPYPSFTFPKHGPHIREHIDSHSPVRAECSSRCSRCAQVFDAAASWCLQLRNCILPMVAHCIFLMGLSPLCTDNSQTSCYSEKVQRRNHLISSHLSALKKKIKRNKQDLSTRSDFHQSL